MRGSSHWNTHYGCETRVYIFDSTKIKFFYYSYGSLWNPSNLFDCHTLNTDKRCCFISLRTVTSQIKPQSVSLHILKSFLLLKVFEHPFVNITNINKHHRLTWHVIVYCSTCLGWMKSELLQNKDMKTSASEFNYSPMKYYLALQQQQKKKNRTNEQ